jgi:hypothetical protein
VSGHLPEGEPVGLGAQELVQPIEAPALALDAVVPLHVLLHEGAHRRRLGDQRRQAPLHDLPLPLALLRARGVQTRVSEVDLLVAEGDALTLGLRRFKPFVEDPAIQSVSNKAPAENPKTGTAGRTP